MLHNKQLVGNRFALHIARRWAAKEIDSLFEMYSFLYI